MRIAQRPRLARQCAVSRSLGAHTPVEIPTPARAHTRYDRAMGGEPFGNLADGRSVERFTLGDADGVTVAILTYGGIIQRLDAPDRDGRRANVTLGFDALERYLSDAYMRRM